MGSKNKLKERKIQSMFARRIKEIRLEKGLNQQQLASTLGCTQGLISQLEAGQGSVTLHIVMAIAEALGCGIDYLIGNEAVYEPDTARGKLLKAFQQFSIEEQEFILRMIEGAAK